MKHVEHFKALNSPAKPILRKMSGISGDSNNDISQTGINLEDDLYEFGDDEVVPKKGEE